MHYHKMRKYLYLFSSLFLIACEEKVKPIITINSDLKHPVSCMKLDPLSGDKALLGSLKKLYPFHEDCNFILTLETSRDIVCNSTNNMMNKSMGKFPKSYIKLELREGIKLQYSYYRDLYSNVDEDDLKEGFERVKKDLLKPIEQ
ncbi:hypothetical protein MNB_SV-3-1290 [hydrothermal vent metagenome]|uniref:Lipoprotein n=1 Tax=hydrothermal vent metagenome TaxID=652676 RepID=A0A1W1CRB5_9ZZZZ